MIRDLPVRAIASCFAMIAFALAILTGMVSGASFNDTMLRGLLVLTACLVVGAFVARAAAVAVNEHIEAFRHEREQALDNAQDPPGNIEEGEPVDQPDAQAPARAAA